MLAKIGMGVVALVVLLLIAIVTRPNNFRVARSTVIAASPDVVFGWLNDLHRWSNWSPYEKQDPAMRLTYSGPPAGVGSAFHYASAKVGEGRMTIVQSTPDKHLGVKAEFIKPFAATNHIDYTIEPAPGGVAVSWIMTGEQTFLGKAFSLFMNMDKMIGTDFEKGLADIKRLSESAQSRPLAATTSAH